MGALNCEGLFCSEPFAAAQGMTYMHGRGCHKVRERLRPSQQQGDVHEILKPVRGSHEDFA